MFSISGNMRVTLGNGKDLSINIFVWWRVDLDTTRNHLIYDEINSSQIAEKMSQNNTYDGFVTILDNVME